MSRTRPTLSRRGTFLVAALVVALALWASGAPSMVYPVYVSEWALSPVVITSIFAVYPVSLVIVLVIFGSISDYVGRRRMLLIGVAVIAAGILVFALASSVGWLFVGRVLQGIGVGLAMSPASATLVDFAGPGGARSASTVNTIAAASGLSLATIVGGALVEYAPLPAHLTFWVLFALAALLLIAVSFMPAHTRDESRGRWRPRAVSVPRGIRVPFTVGTLAIVAGFAMGALFLSLGSQIAKDLIHTRNAFIAGLVISVSALVMIGIAFVARSITPRLAIMAGGVSTAAGLLLVLPAAIFASLPVFVASSLLAGAGYGLLFSGGLSIISQNAPAHHRAGTLSASYLVSYTAQGLTAVGVGVSATALGLESALDLWAPLIAALCLVASGVAFAALRPKVALAQ